ncbi:MAG: dynamin family protein [Cyanobacteria bacterium J06621_12]
MSNYRHLLICLRSLLGSLELASDSALYQDVTALCCYLEHPVYRLAVFAPFNHGKSTLLNALLGVKTLPMDLIPTTGAGIIVKYGSALATEVVFDNGQTVTQPGIEILNQYAVLNQDGQMNKEVAEVRISYPHPWLQTGIELLDLPGTNDREAQNDLVRERLLSADLVLHVLDARKLMTLEERDHLTHWLQNRGITRVIFVVNFLNLLTPDERESVRDRTYHIAESFRSDLPGGISNIYFVDALPALRARLKGNQAAAQETGLTVLETALQAIARSQNTEHKLPRVIKIAAQLLEQAAVKQKELQQVISLAHEESAKRIKVKQKAAQLIQRGFEGSVSDLRGWLYLPSLLANYQVKLAIALTQAQFAQWLTEFELEAVNNQEKINKWIKQGSEFFAHSQPQLFSWDFPAAPVIQAGESTQSESIQSKADSNVSSSDRSSNMPPELNPELNKLLQGKVGAVVLGGASYILNKVAPKTAPNPQKVEPPTKNSSQAYADAAAAYLQVFSDRANAQLTKYEQLAQKYLTFTPQTSSHSSTQEHQLQLLNNLTSNLETELARLKKL